MAPTHRLGLNPTRADPSVTKLFSSTAEGWCFRTLWFPPTSMDFDISVVKQNLDCDLKLHYSIPQLLNLQKCLSHSTCFVCLISCVNIVKYGGVEGPHKILLSISFERISLIAQTN